MGCRSGTVGRYIKDKNPTASVDGIDFFEQAAERAKKHLNNVFKIDINVLEANFSRTLHETIICGDVLEHLLNPQNALQALR